MTTETITEIRVCWDQQHDCWWYMAYDEDSLLDSGPITRDANVSDDDLCGAIEEACRILGKELTPDDFGLMRHDGGVAIWKQVEEDEQ